MLPSQIAIVGGSNRDSLAHVPFGGGVFRASWVAAYPLGYADMRWPAAP